MRAVSLTIAIAVLGCDSKKSATEQPAKQPVPTEQKPAPRAELTDLTAASGLGPARAAFNVHKGEARFLTLLSPT